MPRRADARSREVRRGEAVLATIVGAEKPVIRFSIRSDLFLSTLQTVRLAVWADLSSRFALRATLDDPTIEAAMARLLEIVEQSAELVEEIRIESRARLVAEFAEILRAEKPIEHPRGRLLSLMSDDPTGLQTAPFTICCLPKAEEVFRAGSDKSDTLDSIIQRSQRERYRTLVDFLAADLLWMGERRCEAFYAGKGLPLQLLLPPLELEFLTQAFQRLSVMLEDYGETPPSWKQARKSFMARLK